jgi:hypothetical protein
MSILPENTYQDIIGKDVHEVGLDALCGIAPKGGVVQDVISGGRTAYFYGQPKLAPPQQAVTGFTTSSDANISMSKVDLSVSALNRDFLANVHRELVLQAWAAWRNKWTAFFNSHQGFFGTSWLNAGSVNEQTDGFRAELERWYATYAAEAPSAPSTLAPPSTPLPKSKADVQQNPPDPLIPWWVWVVGAGGIAVLGFVGYKVYQEAKEVRREVLPHLLPVAAASMSRGLL